MLSEYKSLVFQVDPYRRKIVCILSGRITIYYEFRQVLNFPIGDEETIYEDKWTDDRESGASLTVEELAQIMPLLKADEPR